MSTETWSDRVRRLMEAHYLEAPTVTRDEFAKFAGIEPKLAGSILSKVAMWGTAGIRKLPGRKSNSPAVYELTNPPLRERAPPVCTPARVDN